MNDGELHGLSVAIGGLQADVKTLKKNQDADRDDRIDEHRKVHDIVVATNESIRNVARDVSALQKAFEDFKADYAKTKALTEDYRERRAEARGAKKLVVLLYTMGGGAVVVMMNKVVEAFSARPHP